MFHNYTQALRKRLIKGSSKDHGTFGYFCSLLGRLPKARQPKKDKNVCMDVLFTVLKGHYVAYAWEALRLQFQLIALPSAVSHQIKWERFVNFHGGPG